MPLQAGVTPLPIVPNSERMITVRPPSKESMLLDGVLLLRPLAVNARKKAVKVARGSRSRLSEE